MLLDILKKLMASGIWFRLQANTKNQTLMFMKYLMCMKNS